MANILDWLMKAYIKIDKFLDKLDSIGQKEVSCSEVSLEEILGILNKIEIERLIGEIEVQEEYGGLSRKTYIDIPHIVFIDLKDNFYQNASNSLKAEHEILYRKHIEQHTIYLESTQPSRKATIRYKLKNKKI